MAQERDEVQRLFQSGVDAVVAVTADFDEQAWGQPACGSWTAGQTATHLVGVIEWFHAWLDRAIAGDHTRPFPAADIDVRTAADIERLSSLSGPDAIKQFHSRAADYVDRTTAHWDTVYAYPFGIVTTGLHCGVAATEWHLHAWDLATGAGSEHIPSDPGGLFIAAGSCVAAATDGIRGALLARVVPLAARRRPWPTLLKESGRMVK